MRIVCIHTPQISASTEAAKLCVESGKRFGYDVELVKSIWWGDMADTHSALGLKRRYKPVPGGKFDGKRCPRTRMANGTTHYLLYLECLGRGEPLCILEHDAEFVGHLPEPRDGVIQVSSHADRQLTKREWSQCGRANKMRRYEGRGIDWVDGDGVVKHPLNGTNGTSGYIISPDAAAKMVAYIKETGVAFADRVRSEIVGDIWLQKPQSILCYHRRCRSHV